MKRATVKLVFFLLMGINFSNYGQEATPSDSTKNKNIKTGWNFGLLPVVSYNTDLGFQYGGLTNFYYYGDGNIYPEYYHSLYFEISRYTKGSGIYRFFYDSKHLIKGIRTTFDLCYLPDKTLDFYGFNGYQAQYNTRWEDDSNLDDYKTRMFYKQERNIFRAKIDLLGKTGIKNINWVAGISFNNYDISKVDVYDLNEGKEDEDTLPGNEKTLFENYIDWHIISEDEKDGGLVSSVKIGLVYDSRDNEPNPMKGLWTELVVSENQCEGQFFTKLAITHRQYFTIIKKNLSFAYRLSYQGKIAGEMPFYALPNMLYSYNPSSSNDGLGGSKTIRGLIRNRVVGEGIIFGNLELRWKFAHFNFIKQNFYLALSPYADFGQVVQTRKIDKSKIPTIDSKGNSIYQSEYFNNGKDKLHLTLGAGLHIAMNQNFIIAADYGIPLNDQDGKKGLYVGMNFLF